MSISVKDLKIYYIENSKEVKESAYGQGLYSDTLSCFKEAWEQYAKFKNINEPIDYDNELSYADEVIAVFHEDTCKAMIAFGYPDLNSLNYKEDKFLSNWDPDSISKLVKNGKKVQTLTKLARRPGHKLIGGIKELPSVSKWTDLINILIAGNLVRKRYDVSAAMVNEESGIKDYYKYWKTPPIRLSVPISYYGVTAKVHLAAIYEEESKDHLDHYELLEGQIEYINTINYKSIA